MYFRDNNLFAASSQKLSRMHWWTDKISHIDQDFKASIEGAVVTLSFSSKLRLKSQNIWNLNSSSHSKETDRFPWLLKSTYRKGVTVPMTYSMLSNNSNVMLIFLPKIQFVTPLFDLSRLLILAIHFWDNFRLCLLIYYVHCWHCP